MSSSPPSELRGWFAGWPLRRRLLAAMLVLLCGDRRRHRRGHAHAGSCGGSLVTRRDQPAGRATGRARPAARRCRATAAGCSARPAARHRLACGSWTAGSARRRSSTRRPTATNATLTADEAEAAARVPADGRPHTREPRRVRRLPGRRRPHARAARCSSPACRWPDVQTTVWRLVLRRGRGRRGRAAAGRRWSARRSSGCRCDRCGRVAATAGRVAELPLARGEVVAVRARARRRHRPAHRGRPGRRRAEPDARPRRRRAGRPAGQRDPGAAVRRRRQPRAAHPAGRDPRLRRADPAQPRRGAARRGPRDGAGSSRRAPG